MRGDAISLKEPKKITVLSKYRASFKTLFTAPCQNSWIIGQSKNRWDKVSSHTLQKEQSGESTIPILNKKLLTPRMRCIKRNWKYWILEFLTDLKGSRKILSQLRSDGKRLRHLIRQQGL